LIQNNDKEATYKETVEYQTFDGLTMISPDQGNSYDVKVKPGEERIILIRAAIKGFATSASMMSSVILGDTALRKKCLEEG